MTLTVWLGFLVAAILIAITPGPGAVISMSTGMRYGYPVALRAILGLQTAILVQLIVVGLGVGALIVASPAAFSVLRLVGAAYLIWLGWQKWRAPVEERVAESLGKQRAPYWQGVLVNLSNPKAIVFIAALVPQFVDPSRSLPLQYLEIALTLCATDTLVMSCYALAAVRLARWLATGWVARSQNRFFGTVFALAGVLLLISATGS